MPYVPTVRGRRLAHELRRIREQCGLSGEQAANLLGWDQSKISRMETARMRITSREVMELCDAYSVDGDARTALVQIAREARRQGWWHPYRDVLKTGFSQYLNFEAEATTYRSYETQVIPGLFQTGDYARAVLRATRPRTGEEVERATHVRLARQSRVVSGDDRLDVWQIIEEGALHRRVGDSNTMRQQFKHLIAMSELANVSLQVLPFGVGVHRAIDGPFVLLTFDGYPDVLYLEHLMGCIYLEDSAQTTAGGVVFDHLRAAALNVSESRNLIHDMAGRIT
ncbi:transcriptional regulator [Microtetraspora sp. NBRC 13810]|uniref:helix-turn-helix domain-containing protein n=1 Tax=Microtetraspora sp. NBRC 13810 TaxID=3030990 RepID=UPI0024A3AFA1|nr:helix-turn-helix transcriptional regulator [Microtetraspora sp. NBRC 13810]GLW08426.1 transcriptional regulator [Microtetraspora sp. NBRC 13810]